MGKAAARKKGQQGRQAPAQRYEGPSKEGPGQVLVAETYAEAGKAQSQQRLRNHGEHPLTLAMYRGQLVSKYPPDVPEQDRITAQERFAAGEEYRLNFEKMGRSGRDSLDISAGGGGNGLPWSQQQSEAIRWLKRIEDRMHHRDVVIIRAFCGEGHTMVEALRKARINFHPNGVTYRVREALDDLVAATTGKRLIPTPLDVP